MADVSIAVSKFKQVTEAEAFDEDWDQIPALTSYQKTLDFGQQLDCRRPELERLISRHLGVPPSDFFLSDRSDWLWGSFNIILIIDIHDSARRRRPTLPSQAILRIPLPFRSGEDYCPGNVDEKLRCEAATYVWLRRHCPSIPTPRLLGMGFPDGPSFTAIENESRWNRLVWHLRRGWAWLHGEWLPPYFSHPRDGTGSDFGYLLIEFITKGWPLSSSWDDHCSSGDGRRGNLYRGLANILLDLKRMPLPRIGSWTMNNRGVISLTNRPLIDLTMLWSRHEIPTGVPRDLTYTSADSYTLDLIAYQDMRMRHQPNAILGRSDGIYQLSALSAFRALLPKFCDRASGNGPFFLTLTDLHKSNIIVDADWNVVGVIDLEFAPVLPAQQTHVPLWFSGHSIDELHGDCQQEYKVHYDQFVEVLESVETQQDHALSQQFREAWQTGRIWYTAALSSPNGFPILFENVIRPKFFHEFDLKVDGLALTRLWDENFEEFIVSKLKDNERYLERVRELFAAARAAQPAKVGETGQPAQAEETGQPEQAKETGQLEQAKETG